MEDFATLTAKIVASYVGNNVIAQDELPDFIAAVNRALVDISEGLKRPAAEPAVFKPAVSISKSITTDYIVCLEDGTKYKSLKRHLRAHHSLTPTEYRQKWGLPADYPMVAPTYKTTRVSIAKTSGLGRRKATKKP